MKQNGFTLIEVISVITLLSLLVIITTPAYSSLSNNIKERNYDSKKNTIKSQTLSYVEKYMKDEIYQSDSLNKYYCFTVEYLIQNGIISSDSEEKEYIKNDMTGEEYITGEYVQIYYDNNKFKLIANTKDDVLEDSEKEDDNSLKCNVTL